MVRNGFCTADESTFVSYAQRFANGDRPIVDDWSQSQLFALLLCPAYKLYVAIKGSTTGIILYMRFVFLAFNAVVYWIVYLCLRKYRWTALLATLLFCMYVPFGIFACSYSTVAPRLLMIVCLILFSETQKPWELLTAGVLLSCSVLFQPGFAFLYFAFTECQHISRCRRFHGLAARTQRHAEHPDGSAVFPARRSRYRRT